MTLHSILRVSLAWLALHATAEAFEGTYSVGVGRDQSKAIIRRLSDREYRLTVTTTEGACTGRVEARATLSGDVLTTTRGRVPGPGAEVADICKMTVARTPDGIRIAEETCSIFHGARCGFAGVYRGSGAGRSAGVSGGQAVVSAPPARLSAFYCKTPETMEPEQQANPAYRVRLPSPDVRPELAYEIFLHGGRFAFPEPGGDPSDLAIIANVRASVGDDVVTVTGRAGQRWTVRPAGGAVVTITGSGLKQPVMARGCVWR